MGQVTFYIDDKLEAKMRATVKTLNISQSKWISSLIEAKLQNEWPESIKDLAGAWQDFPELEALRQGEGQDATREIL
ncbi:MAG: CopG family transcriptional regulator [Calditrichaeota bacterium]|nr:CopG family transcriptional regulator [Calditrichota bacterium]